MATLTRRMSADVFIEDEVPEVPFPDEYKEESEDYGGLDGRTHDRLGFYERHWNTLRNLFPQCLRCQEREDAVTDNYTDQLGPRGLGPPEEDGSLKSCLPAALPGCEAEQEVSEDQQEQYYRQHIMPKLVLPAWCYTKEGQDTVSMQAAMKNGWGPEKTAEQIASDSSQRYAWDKNFDMQCMVQGRLLKESRLLREKAHDQPMSDEMFTAWNSDLERLKEVGANPASESLEDPIPGIPFLDRTHDKYELLTWQWMRVRVQEEDEEIAKQAVSLVPNLILQIACAATVWGLGSTEIDGGRVEVVVASFCVGIVCIISSIIGLLGVLAENELFLRIFWISQLWVLALLVAFIYTEAHHIQATHYACNPGSDLGGSNTSSSECDETTAIQACSMIISGALLLLGFIGVYMTTALMDSINDRTAIEDSVDQFKYLQYYLNELLKRCGMAETGEKSGCYVDPLHGPVRTRQENGLWCTSEDMSGEEPHAPDME